MKNKIEFPRESAEKIVQMFHKVTGGHVNFMNQDGIIVATTQPERLKTIHEGAKRILTGEADELVIDIEEAEELKNTVSGYNGAVLYKGDKIACIELTGDPKKIQLFHKLAVIVAAKQYAHFLSENPRAGILEKEQNSCI